MSSSQSRPHTGNWSEDPRDTWVSVRSKHLRVRLLAPGGSWEQAASTCLVFLHEGLGCVEMWKTFPERLCEATGLPGLIYDRQGHGRSSPLTETRTPEYQHEEALDFLPQVLRRLNIQRPVLIGHSDGGTIALIFAARFPDWPVCVVTEAAHVFVEEVTVQGIRQAKQAFETTNLPDKLAKYHGDKTRDIFSAWADTWLDPKYHSWNIESELPSIRCPLLVIQGEKDEYGSLEQVESIVDNSSGPAEPLIIPGRGHIPHLEAEDEVIEGVVGFLGKHGLLGLCQE